MQGGYEYYERGYLAHQGSRGRGRGLPMRNYTAEQQYAAQQYMAQVAAHQRHFPGQILPGQQPYLSQQVLGQHQHGIHPVGQHGSQHVSPQQSPQALRVPSYPDVHLPR